LGIEEGKMLMFVECASPSPSLIGMMATLLPCRRHAPKAKQTFVFRAPMSNQTATPCRKGMHGMD
jgi:hypothetical protein